MIKVIFCSVPRGSAFPATLAFQIRELERETKNDLRLDAIATVIDAENFEGYEDTSPTAKMQASYTDMIIIVRKVRKSTNQRSNSPVQNKWEHVSERQLDILIDHLNTLNDTTPKIKCQGRDGVDPNVIMGLDSKLFELGPAVFEAPSVRHHDEVETATIFSGSPRPAHTHDESTGECPSCKRSGANSAEPHAHSGTEGESEDLHVLTESELVEARGSLSKETTWRVKGIVKLSDRYHILNWAFGRFELTPVDTVPDRTGRVKLTVMGERGEVKRAARKLAGRIRAEVA